MSHGERVLVAHEVADGRLRAGETQSLSTHLKEVVDPANGSVAGSAALDVRIDIKPGSYPNSVNPSKGGVVPVAIMGRPPLDAAAVDLDSLCFGDAESPGERDCTPASGTSVKDVDGDGVLDLVLRFETQQTGIDRGDTQACLSARLSDGAPVFGCDSVKTKQTGPTLIACRLTMSAPVRGVSLAPSDTIPPAGAPVGRSRDGRQDGLALSSARD